MCKNECDCCEHEGKTVHAQLSSSIDQPNGPLGVGVPITFNNHDSIHDVSHLLGSSEIHITTDGLYFVLAAPQVGSLTEGGFTADYWIKVNGNNCPNTNVRIESHTHETKDVVVTQGLLKLDEGDVLQIYGSGTNSKSEAIIQVSEPLIPSIILSLYKAVSYTHLTLPTTPYV